MAHLEVIAVGHPDQAKEDGEDWVELVFELGKDVPFDKQTPQERFHRKFKLIARLNIGESVPMSVHLTELEPEGAGVRQLYDAEYDGVDNGWVYAATRPADLDNELKP